MKKLLVVLSIGVFAISCGGGNDAKSDNAAAPSEEAKKDAVEESADANPKGADYEKGLALVAQSDCLTCHKINEKLTGPAYKDVANRYQPTDAVIDSLSTKIIKGGAGNWGQI